MAQMSESIGVLDGRLLMFANPKQWYLAFDGIAAVHLGASLDQARRFHKDEYLINNIDWLLDQGFIEDVDVSRIDPVTVFESYATDAAGKLEAWLDFVHHAKTVNEGFDRQWFATALRQGTEIERREALLEWLFWLYRAGNLGSRFWSMILSRVDDRDYMPIQAETLKGFLPLPNYQDCTSVVLSRIPEPDDATPWERLVDFKNDPDIRMHYIELHRWVRSLVNDGRSAREAAQELDYLVARFEDSMRLHRIEHGKGELEWLITTPAEVTEEVIKGKFGDLSRRLFSTRQRKIDLQRAERDAPGREVAYVVRTNEHFS